MTVAADWIARFFREGESARHREVGEMIAAERRAPVRPAVTPIVVEQPCEYDLNDEDDPDESGIIAPAHRVARAALAAGWRVWAVRAGAAVPGTGIVQTWSVRCARHDERVIAVWWITPGEDGKRMTSFNLGIYQGPAAIGVEQLGMETLDQRVRRMAKAAAEGKPVPAPLKIRGVLDAINGVRLPS